VGDGTKKLEVEVSQKWPNARIKRVDRDNSDWQYLKSTYAQSQAGEIDILIGTQMISRGLDIENLTVVGIVDADSALQIPDFSASERTFQLISQAAGRAGRRATLGTVIIQTRNPTSRPIVAAAANSFTDFYNSEMKYRKDFAYPPYVYLVKLEYADKSAAKSERMAGELRTQLVKLTGVTVLGPTMRTRKSLTRESVAQIIVKSSIRSALINICKQLPAGWVADLDPIQLL
jgi:primosomal protein N' (replication factor Y)